MSLDPQVAAFLAQANHAPPPASIKDYVLPGEHALTVRAYMPAGAEGHSLTRAALRGAPAGRVAQRLAAGDRAGVRIRSAA